MARRHHGGHHAALTKRDDEGGGEKKGLRKMPEGIPKKVAPGDPFPLPPPEGGINIPELHHAHRGHHPRIVYGIDEHPIKDIHHNLRQRRHIIAGHHTPAMIGVHYHGSTHHHVDRRSPLKAKQLLSQPDKSDALLTGNVRGNFFSL